MRAVIQRVTRASVTVDGNRVSEIKDGLLILLGIGTDDNEDIARAMTKKIAALRIFQDDADKMNLSVRDIGGSAIVVSQFTLYADCRKGNRPSFVGAAAPALASPLVDRFVELLKEQGVPSQRGVFGAHMDVELLNSGPVTIILEM
ncbi:MAG: D-tyrosyl-tRNA(Tyr) deacylase [Flexilinea sp.]|nr:D-tyrosyl-tRNA(Tyr) deacylase [Flexilinea sp.]